MHDVTLDRMTLNILKANEKLLLINKLRICLIYSNIDDSRYADRHRQEAKKIANALKRKICPLHNDSHGKPSG